MGVFQNRLYRWQAPVAVRACYSGADRAQSWWVALERGLCLQVLPEVNWLQSVWDQAGNLGNGCF